MNQAIQQWRVFLWGRAFTIITDCRALQWLDTYEGENTAVCRLKFGIIGYSFRVCHRHRHLNEYPDSLSQLVINTYLCPNITGKYSDYTTLNEYYYLAHKFKLDSPSPTDHITPDKLPGFRRKKPTSRSAPTENTSPSFSHTAISFSNVKDHGIEFCSLFNNDIMRAAHNASTFSWMVHGLECGTFYDTIRHHGIPFQVHAAIDVTPHGRNWMQIFAKIPDILSNSDQFLTFIKQRLNITIQGYYVTIPELYSKAD